MNRKYEGVPHIKHADWLAEGEKLFGPNSDEWRYRCPVCGHVAASKDFQPYADKGADPSSAAQECIGRYTGAGPHQPGKQPCNWAAYGLFMLCRRVVEFPDGTVTPVFDFAPAEEKEKAS